MAEILTHPSSEQPQKGTTNATIAQDLRASLAARRGVFVGTTPTLRELLLAFRALGISDDMPISSFEFGVAATGDGTLTVDTDDDGLALREGRR